MNERMNTALKGFNIMGYISFSSILTVTGMLIMASGAMYYSTTLDRIRIIFLMAFFFYLHLYPGL